MKLQILVKPYELSNVSGNWWSGFFGYVSIDDYWDFLGSCNGEVTTRKHQSCLVKFGN